MNITGIIPSRYSSSRFPGKPLVDIKGKTMIRRVYEQALQAKMLNYVVVATDDERIFDEVKNFGGNVIFTSPNHVNGTERCAEAASKLNAPTDVVINIQGDEPFIKPEQIDLLASCFVVDQVQIATLVRNFKSEEEKLNHSRVKAFVDADMRAITFSRHPLPTRVKSSNYQLLKHIGVYAFRTEVLKKIVNLPVSVLEGEESLEQLRWIENWYSIYCAYTEHESISIDTPEDLKGLL